MIRIAFFYLIQLLLIIHIIRNHKGFGWIWLLVFLPFVGGLAYLIVEILPELFRGSRHSAALISDRVFPGKKLEKALNDVRFSDTPYNKLVLADTYFETNDLENAENLYRELTDGWYKADSDVLLKYGKCLIARGNFSRASLVLQRAADIEPFTRTQHKALFLYAGFMDSSEEKHIRMLEELYRNTHDLESGYYLCLAYGQEKDTDRIRLTLASMKTQVRNHRYLKKTLETQWISRAEKLLV